MPGCPGCPTPEKFQKSIQLHKSSPNKIPQTNSRLWAPDHPILKILPSSLNLVNKKLICNFTNTMYNVHN